MNFLHEQADSCGYTSFLNEYLVYPPAGPLPNPPMSNDTSGQCDLWDAIFYAELLINPCFDIYQIATTWYVFLESLFPLLNQILSLETCFGSFHSVDVFQGSSYPLQKAGLTLKS